MALIVWDDSMSIGVSEIDAQHKRLFVLANDVAATLERVLARARTGCGGVNLAQRGGCRPPTRLRKISALLLESEDVPKRQGDQAGAETGHEGRGCWFLAFACAPWSSLASTYQVLMIHRSTNQERMTLRCRQWTL